MSSFRQWDCDYVWHPFTAMTPYRTENAPLIVAGDGFFLIDEDGHRYLDGHSSLWCNLHGHRVPAIDQAIRDQLDRIAHSTLLGLGNDRSAELAAALVDRAPAGLEQVFFSDNGSTAVEVAMKLAWQYHRQKPHPEPRDLFVCLSAAYHGDTMGAVSLGGIDQFHSVFGGMMFPALRVPAPVALRHPPEHTPDSYLDWCLKELERTLATHAERIAAFVIEPLVQAAAGMLVHPSGYLRKVRQLTEQHGILLIADEVAVGFGRTGTLFACEREQVPPDFLCLSKGITGGYLPLAATLCTKTIESAFLGETWENRTFFHGHTYTGNPLGSAAALASLQLLEENQVLQNGQQLSQVLTEELAPLQTHPHVAEVRQCGTMVGIELVADRQTLAPFPKPLRTGHQVTLACREKRLIVRNIGDVLALMPAPAMPSELVRKLCQTVVTAIQDVCPQ